MTESRTTPASHAVSAPSATVAAVALVALVLAVPAALGAVQISVVDGQIQEQSARPTAADPGPVLHDAADGLTFSSGLTDGAAIWFVDPSSATNNSSATQATMQGEEHTFIDWFYGKQGGAAKYASFRATGTYDPNAGGYRVPFLFTKSSQGTIQIVSYAASGPTDGGTTVTYHWAYDAGANRYVFGATKDLSGATKVAPISTTGLGVTYTTTMEANQYVVTAVGGGPDHVPTLKQGKHLTFLSLPLTHTWYLLMDPPAGVHEDTYTFELQVTAQAL